MKHSRRTFLKDYSITILVALSIAFFLRTFIIEAYQVSNIAMQPTLLKGDTIFVAKWPTWLKGKSFPLRGDVIVYSEKTPSHTSHPDRLKRVVGLAGDTVQSVRGELILNGQKLSSMGKEMSSPMENFGPEVIPPEFLLVIDDLRIQPTSSKSLKPWSMIPHSSVKGLALWIWLSIDPNGRNGSQSSWLPSFRFDRMFKRIH